MTYAAKIKASRLKPAIAAANSSALTANAQHNLGQKVQGHPNMPSSIGHGFNMDNARMGANGVLDSNRSRHGIGGVQKSSNTASRRRSFHPLSIRLPSAGMRVVKDNYFVQALSHTTYAFCRETTLHGMKYVVQDIEELGSTFSR